MRKHAGRRGIEVRSVLNGNISGGVGGGTDKFIETWTCETSQVHSIMVKLDSLNEGKRRIHRDPFDKPYIG